MPTKRPHGSGDPSQGGTHAQKVAAGRKGGKARRRESVERNSQ